jgi:cation:H+ antiporter
VGYVVWIAAALAPPLAWFVVHFGHLVSEPLAVALWSGAAIFGAAFLLSWASEVAQLDISRSLALVFLALIAVLPEYAVDVYFAWRAGKDPAYTAFATANMTGSNRLLIGLGWATAVFALWIQHRRSQVELPRAQSIELNYLAVATLYSFLLPIKGTLSVIDTVILFLIFLAYARAAAKAQHEEPELEGPAAFIAGFGATRRRLAVLAIGIVSTAAIFTAAEPFAESLIATGRSFGIEEFLLVQWLAPLVSESPEFIVAILFALRGSAASSIGTLVSSAVNQWTLLVGALPAAYAISHGSWASMILDGRQREEVLLTSAQSIFALVVISNFKFSVVEAFVLLGLFLPQLCLTSPAARWAHAFVYLALTAGMVIVSPSARRGVVELLPIPGRRRRAG